MGARQPARGGAHQLPGRNAGARALHGRDAHAAAGARAALGGRAGLGLVRRSAGRVLRRDERHVVGPRLGAATLLSLIVLGQLLTSLLVDHFGWIGFPAHPLSLVRLAGAVLLFAGVVLITR